MKKLLLSMVAVAVMSSSAFANAGESATTTKTASETTFYRTANGDAYIEVNKEVTEVKEGNSFRQACHYTVNYYNGGGIKYNSTTFSTNVGGSGDVFSSCGEFFNFIDNGHRTLGYTLTKSPF